MQQPSLADFFIIPFLLASIAVITALWAKGANVKTRTAIFLYCIIALLGYGAYRYRLYEYNQLKALDRVVMRSHSAYLYEQSINKGEYAHFQVINLSSKRVRMTNFWLDKCGDGGGDFSFSDIPPQSLEPSDDYTIAIPVSSIHCHNWFYSGRARLTDGSVIISTKDEDVPAKGSIGFLYNPTSVRDPQSLQFPTHAP